eukprot:scaffold68296_cov32-Tisochrysis_lutea.AAC.4
MSVDSFALSRWLVRLFIPYRCSSRICSRPWGLHLPVGSSIDKRIICWPAVCLTHRRRASRQLVAERFPPVPFVESVDGIRSSAECGGDNRDGIVPYTGERSLTPRPCGILAQTRLALAHLVLLSSKCTWGGIRGLHGGITGVGRHVASNERRCLGDCRVASKNER